jgi:mRNA interferase MazF
VCLTEPIGAHRHVILAFITSQIPTPPLDTDLVLDATNPDFAATGLRTKSALRLHRVMTVAESLIQRELGELTPRSQAEIDQRLRRLFGL